LDRQDPLLTPLNPRINDRTVAKKLAGLRGAEILHASHRWR
jgi:hypothetical protein